MTASAIDVNPTNFAPSTAAAATTTMTTTATATATTATTTTSTTTAVIIHLQGCRNQTLNNRSPLDTPLLSLLLD